MSVKLLTEHHFEFLGLKAGCTGSSEPPLVKMPHCWKSRVTAHLVWFCLWINTSVNSYGHVKTVSYPNDICLPQQA